MSRIPEEHSIGASSNWPTFFSQRKPPKIVVLILGSMLRWNILSTKENRVFDQTEISGWNPAGFGDLPPFKFPASAHTQKSGKIYIRKTHIFENCVYSIYAYAFYTSIWADAANFRLKLTDLGYIRDISVCANTLMSRSVRTYRIIFCTF